MAKFNLESKVSTTQDILKNLYTFLSDFKNFAGILPEDKVADFQYSENECSFTIKGITRLTIKLEDKNPFEFILFRSQGLAKFDFWLKVDFIGNADLIGQCKVNLSGDMNPFILAMAEKPLNNLIDTMSLKLSQLKTESHEN